MVLAAGSGIGAGLVAVHLWGNASVPLHALEQELFAGAAEEAKKAGTPRIRVKGAEYDFGTTFGGGGGRHTLIIHNDGDAPLEVRCRRVQGVCQVMSMQRMLIAPGSFESVTIRWPPPSRPGKTKLVLELCTNDPRRPRIPITISGTVIVRLMPEPSLVRFSLRHGETGRRIVKLLSPGFAQLHVQRMELRPRSENSVFRTRMLPPPSSPTDGSSLPVIREIEVSVSQGLPPGKYKNTVDVFIDGSDQPVAVIDLLAEVHGPFRVVGKHYDALGHRFLFGRVSASRGRTFHLTVIGRGKQIHKTSLQVEEVSPEFVQVRIGSPEKIPGKGSWRWPLRVQVPPDAPLGEFPKNISGPPARIVLKTDHPEQPKLEIPFEFSVVP